MEGSPQSTLSFKKVRDKATLCLHIFLHFLQRYFYVNKNIRNIKVIKQFEKGFLCTAYAGDSTFFLKGKNSIQELLNIHLLYGFKAKLARIGALKGVEVVICGIKCVDLTRETIKILGVFFSYDRNLQLESKFKKTILSTERNLKMWRRWNLTLKDKIIISKTVSSKVTFLV